MNRVVIVTGLGRCGTTAVMEMLAAGGMPVVGKKPGYEHYDAAIGRFRQSWLDRQAGAAVKLIDPGKLPLELRRERHAVIFLTRDAEQQAASQAKFLSHFTGQPIDTSRRTRRAHISSLDRDTHKLDVALKRSGCPTFVLPFEYLVLKRDESADQMATFLSQIGFVGLDRQKMAQAIIPRTPRCLPGMLEHHKIVDFAVRGGR